MEVLKEKAFLYFALNFSSITTNQSKVLKNSLIVNFPHGYKISFKELLNIESVGFPKVNIINVLPGKNENEYDIIPNDDYKLSISEVGQLMDTFAKEFPDITITAVYRVTKG